MHAETHRDAQPIVARLEEFDTTSGSLVERVFFNHRPWVMAICLAITLLLGWQALGMKLNASFEKTIPTKHPYIVNYLAHKADLAGQGNALRIAVAVTQGTIFDKDYLETLRKLNDEIFLLPGVDRPFMKSLWTSNTRWVAVSEEGLDGDTVMSDRYDGSPETMAEVRANVERSGEIGQLVAADFQSSIVYVPLLDKDPRTGAALDYAELRAKYQNERVHIHVIGFAKVMGDLMEGLRQVLGFFALALVITATVLFGYTRCVRSTAIVVACSLVAVVWQFGLLRMLHYELDPYSVLVPFLVFAIGMSHGAQKMNGILQDVGRGTHRVVAARYTFRRLFVAGLTALLCDAVGFAVLALIEIRVIQDLAAVASIGVAVLIFTNLVLLPILLSYTGVSPKAAARSLKQEQQSVPSGAWVLLGAFTRTRPALAAIGAALLLAGLGFALSLQLRIGDLDPGAPELRAESRYNRDNAYVVQHYAASTDILTVMVTTPEDHCTRYATLSQVDSLAWRLQQLPGVEGTQSMAGLSKLAMIGYNEGNLKWYELIPNDQALGGVQARAPRELFNQGCSFLSVYVYLKDHKAETLAEVGRALHAGRRLGRNRRRDQHRRAQGDARNAAVGVWRGARAVLVHVPLLARHAGGGAAAGADVDPVRSADGAAGHGRQGGHAAGDRAGCGHRRGLRALRAGRHAHAHTRRRQPRRCVPASAAVHRPGRAAHRADAGTRGGHLGLQPHQVPGRHGFVAGLHVPLEHGRRSGAAAGPGALAAEAGLGHADRPWSRAGEAGALSGQHRRVTAPPRSARTTCSCRSRAPGRSRSSLS
jgi:predicted RND superfamily exporter protein